MIKATRKHNIVLAGLLGMTALAPIAAHAQMIPGYNPPQAQNQPQQVVQAAPLSHHKDPERKPSTQAPVLPERPGGLIGNPMPSSVAPKLTSPPPSNRVMSLSSNHINQQVTALIKDSDERIKGISLGNEKFPDEKTPMTELDREMSYDQRIREMNYLQKLSEQGIKLFNTTYDGKREWDYGDGLNVIDPHNQKPQTVQKASGSSGPTSPYGSSGSSSVSDDDDDAKIAKEKAELEQKRLEAERTKMEEAKQAHEEAHQRHLHDLEVAKKRMAEASPDPKVTMIYGVGRNTQADILIPYVGRVVGLKVGSVINGDNKMTITSIGSNTVSAKDDSGKIHTLEMGDTVDKVRPSLSKFMPKEDDE